MAAMELDFEEAALQAKAHPGINSGDLVKNIILVENEEKSECNTKEEKGCKNKKIKLKNNSRRLAPKNDGKWEIIKKMADENSSNKGNRIEKYGKKVNVNKSKIEEEGKASLLERTTLKPEVVKQKYNKDPGLLNSIHSETLESTPDGHILDQLIIFHPNNRKRSRESQIISQMLLPEGGFHGKLTGGESLGVKPDEDWTLPEVETQKSSGESISSFTSTTPLSIFPAPDFSLIKPGSQQQQQVLQRLEEERKRIDKVYDLVNRERNVYELIKRIKASDADNRPLTVLQSKTITK